MKILLPLVLLIAASVDTTANRATRRSQRNNPIRDQFISIKDTVRYLGVTQMTVRNMIRDGRLAAYTLGPRVLRIRLSDIDASMSRYGGINAS
jgi:excisionase family DNA binding protein